jgi:hypothetical protein
LFPLGVRDEYDVPGRWEAVVCTVWERESGGRDAVVAVIGVRGSSVEDGLGAGPAADVNSEIRDELGEKPGDERYSRGSGGIVSEYMSNNKPEMPTIAKAWFGQ